MVVAPVWEKEEVGVVLWVQSFRFEQWNHSGDGFYNCVNLLSAIGFYK